MTTAPWTLPPEQRILQGSETTCDLDRIARELTVVVSTSVGELTPSTEPVVACLQSLQDNVALRWCRKLLVFDCLPTEAQLQILMTDRKRYTEVVRGPKWRRHWERPELYEQYCKAVKEMKAAGHPAFFNVELIFLESFGHLFGTIKTAFQMIRTPYVFVTQHDLRLGGHFVAADVQRTVEALSTGRAKYVVLNRDTNSGPRTKVHFRLLPERALQSDNLNLTAIAGFSDQAHFVDAEWYRQEVVEAIQPEIELTCMEHVLHEPWKNREQWMGTFLYGGADDGPYVLDLVHGVQVYSSTGVLSGLPPPPSRSARPV